MKYFSPSYWFKLWVLSAPLFNDKTIGINAKSIDNKKIKNWVSNNTNLQLINQDISFTNSSINYQPYNLNQQLANQNIDPIYQTNLDSISSQELEVSTHKHRHEKSKIIKRGVNSDRENAIEFKQNWWTSAEYGVMYASFTPKFWEEIGYLQGTSNNREQFIQSFKNKVTSGVWKDHRLEGPIHDPSYKGMEGIGESIWDNWSSINNVWQQSSKTKMMRIDVEKAHNSKLGEYTFIFKDCRIRGDSVILSNPYLDNLKRDLNGDYDKEVVSLGIVGFFEYDHILKKALNKKYPVLRTEQISIINLVDYNPNEDYTQSFKLRINGNSQHYSHGDLKPKFIFTTEQFLTYILPRLIWENGNDLFTDWTNKVSNWKLRLDRQIMEDVPTFTQAQKRTWVDNQKTILEDKIHDAKQNLAIVDLRMKNKHLYKVVNQIEKDFDFLKNEINELDKRITNLENTSNVNCANIATIIAGVIAPVPFVGTAASSIATITAGACAIAGV